MAASKDAEVFKIVDEESVFRLRFACFPHCGRSGEPLQTLIALHAGPQEGERLDEPWLYVPAGTSKKQGRVHLGLRLVFPILESLLGLE
jgi:hypothetical protein